jgi:hypothetical protein
MKMLRYMVIAAAVAASSATVRAADPLPLSYPTPVPGAAPLMSTPGCASCGGGHAWGKHGGLFGGYAPPPSTLFNGHRNFNFNFMKKPQLPVFQAAPWYNYWPYDAHFLTPAPISGPFYGPPQTGNFPVNPYFPGPAGATGWGPIPGGPPPVMAPGGGR